MYSGTRHYEWANSLFAAVWLVPSVRRLAVRVSFYRVNCLLGEMAVATATGTMAKLLGKASYSYTSMSIARYKLICGRARMRQESLAACAGIGILYQKSMP